jgi:hypothetical protein
MGELISGNGWPDCNQERKLLNHVATAPLPEGVVMSYFTGAKGGVAGIIIILA